MNWSQSFARMAGTPLAATLFAATFVAGALTGCVSPRPAPYGNEAARVPSSWSERVPVDSGRPAAAGAWWDAANDPVLAHCIEQALERNADVQRALVRMEQAAAKAGLDAGDLFPMLQGYLSASRQKYLRRNSNETFFLNGIPISIGGFGGAQQSITGNVTFSYLVDFWGTQRNAARASRAALAGSAADVETARWLISTKVAEQYWTYAASRDKAALDREDVDRREQDLATAQVRAAAQAATLEELSNALQKRATAREQLFQDESAAEQARIALAVLLDDAPQSFALPDAGLPRTGIPEPTADIPAAVLDRRPDVHAARLALDAALLREKVATASYYPSLNLQTSLLTGGAALKDILSNPFLSTGLQLSLPFLDWQDLRYKRALARADVHAAAVELRAKIYGALSDLEIASVLRARVRQEFEDATRLAQGLDELAAKDRVRAEYGYLASQELSDALANRLAARRALIDAQLSAWKNYVDIAKALGGPV